MAGGGLKQVLGRLRHVLLPPDGGELTDAQLLARFVADREQDAFAALVRRHGPMVLGVCRRVLGHAHDAEDAFQAVFLVLARKAKSVVRREALAGFLYGVACRTALRARARTARRRATERQVDPMPHPPVAPAEAQDWRALLDRELGLLPPKYQAAVVLCDLQGKTRRQAARQLGLSEGTLSSRLARARQLLGRRLARAGVSLPAGALALADGASAAVPARLVGTTVRAAVLVAAGKAAAVTTPAAALMKEVLQAMLLTKLKLSVAAVCVVAALAAGGLVYRASAQAPGGPPPRSEVDALRHRVELLQLNLDVLLEKVHAQEAELRALRGHVQARPGGKEVTLGEHAPVTAPTVRDGGAKGGEAVRYFSGGQRTTRGFREAVTNYHLRTVINVPVELVELPDPVQQVQEALKTYREARDAEARRRALADLEKALAKLKEQTK
jgi:RNA polymerase sigma factor (sigma-70 family)